MSKKDRKNPGNREGELSEQQLDRISGGQEVRKMETIVVTAKRPAAQQKVVKMETIVVTAQREKPDVTATRLASVGPGKLRK